MSPLLFAAAVLLASANEPAGTPLTFDEAVALAGAKASTSAAAPLDAAIDELRRGRLPNVRAEVAGNTSRTLDLFSEGPLEVRYATSVVAFDYPLWDGGATNARISTLAAKLRRLAAQGGMDDARFMRLLDAFGELYLAQREGEILRPFVDELSAADARSADLLATGEISNLMAAERREVALGFSSRFLELEARRVDAAATIRLLTGLDSEPRLVLDVAEPFTVDAASDHVADDMVRAATIAVDESNARLREVTASNAFRATLSGFGGVGTAQSQFRHVSSEGAFGVYGLRINLSYPIFRGTSAIAMAEARTDLAQTVAMRNAAMDAAKSRAAEYRLREETAGKRISLLQQSVTAAKEREESLQRLITAGMRSESDLAQARSERIRREAGVLAAQIDRWKAVRLLRRMTASVDAGEP